MLAKLKYFNFLGTLNKAVAILEKASRGLDTINGKLYQRQVYALLVSCFFHFGS